MRLFYLPLLLACLLACERGWIPPENPDPKQILDEAQNDFKAQRFEDALAKYIWFHNHALEYEPAKMYGVRLSFALTYWKQLGDVYEPALKAFVKIRDEKTELIEKRMGNRDLFHDVMALNRTLGEDDKTVDLFRKLDQDQKELASQCWKIAKRVVIKAKAYDLVRIYIGNLGQEFDKIVEVYDSNKTMYDNENFGEEFKAYNENNFVEETLSLIKLAVALDDIENARDIQTDALSIIDDNRLKDVFDWEGAGEH